MILIFAVLFGISFLLAFLSLRDLEVPKEIRRSIEAKRVRGSIIFFKNKKTKHYRARR